MSVFPPPGRSATAARGRPAPDLPVAFSFRVSMMRSATEAYPLPPAFQEVSGLEHVFEVEEVAEGGENGFVYQLPKPPRARRLFLKRGLVARQSAFVSWCSTSMENGFNVRLELRDLQVQLLGADATPLMTWRCTAAYPVRWTIQRFDALANELAVEELELAYQSLVNAS
jgi:phage tail-like protein